MHVHDIAGMALLTVRQQRARAALSLVGVVIGSLVMVISFSARQGVHDAVARVFSGADQLRRIEIRPSYSPNEDEIPADELEVQGEMSEAKRKRIRKMLVSRWRNKNFQAVTGLTAEKIAHIEALDHVEKVVPGLADACDITVGDQTSAGTCVGMPADTRVLRDRVVAGHCFDADNGRGVLVSEFLAYRCGYVTRTELQQLVGHTVRLEFRHGEQAVVNSLIYRAGGQVELSDEEVKTLNDLLDRMGQLADQLPLAEEQRSVLKKVFQPARSAGGAPVEAVIREEFTIAGVFRTANEDEEPSRWGWFNRFDDTADVVLPVQTAAALWLRLPGRAEFGFQQATATVDSEANLNGVAEQIRKMNLTEYSLEGLVENIQAQVAVVTWVLAGLGAFALLVSALAIANTMVMSVVERTHEIGVMKAVGARDSHILLIFVVEGALLGLLGAGVALAAGWAATFPLDALARSILAERLDPSFRSETALVFPAWLFLAVPAFAAAVTTLASIVPARRAARVSPIVALRHE